MPQNVVIPFLCVTFFFLEKYYDGCKLELLLHSVSPACLLLLPPGHPCVSPHDITSHLRHLDGLHACPMALQFTLRTVAGGGGGGLPNIKIIMSHTSLAPSNPSVSSQRTPERCALTYKARYPVIHGSCWPLFPSLVLL